MILDSDTLRVFQQDTEYELYTVTDVTDDGDCWHIAAGAVGFALEKVHGVRPGVGDVVRTYGTFGHVIRGVVVGDVVAFYRTEEQERVRHEAWVAAQRAKKRAEYDAQRATTEARLRALPPAFQERVIGFRASNPKFWEFEGYEIFCCEEAVKIAATLKDKDAVVAFGKMSKSEQKETVPTLAYDQHSGNTFGVAVLLACHYLVHPDLLPREHGALCPLVGCEEYGCAAARAEGKSA